MSEALNLMQSLKRHKVLQIPALYAGFIKRLVREKKKGTFEDRNMECTNIVSGAEKTQCDQGNKHTYWHMQAYMDKKQRNAARRRQTLLLGKHRI